MSYLHPIAARLWSARHVVQEETLAHNISLVTGPAGVSQVQVLGGVIKASPDGSNREIVLPAADRAVAGVELVVEHGDGANTIAVLDGATTVATVATTETATVRCVQDSSGWRWMNLGVHKVT